MGPEPAGEDGFMLLGLIVAIAIIMLVMGVAASKVAFSLQREREAESARRARLWFRSPTITAASSSSPLAWMSTRPR